MHSPVMEFLMEWSIPVELDLVPVTLEASWNPSRPHVMVMVHGDTRFELDRESVARAMTEVVSTPSLCSTPGRELNMTLLAGSERVSLTVARMELAKVVFATETVVPLGQETERYDFEQEFFGNR